MNKKEELQNNRAKWLAALRSGDYSQDTGQLQGGDGFCCLGVACDVFQKETGLKLPVNQLGYIAGGSLFSYEDEDLGADFVSPSEVQEWLGLRHRAGEFEQKVLDGLGLIPELHKHVHSLVSLNDTALMTFEQIADVIEANPAGLFEE